MKRAYLALLTTAALAGCQAPAQAPKEEDFRTTDKITWKTLKDGSLFGTGRFGDIGAVALRCWKGSTGKFTCIAGWQMGDSLDQMLSADTRYSVYLNSYDELPKIALYFEYSQPGYSCDYSTTGLTETITGSNGALETNYVGIRGGRWSKGFVNQYMADNGVEGPTHFPCAEVVDKLSRGSLATLGTTSITKAMIGK
jgi:hypothetical protein